MARPHRTSPSAKQDAYAALVARRKACERCPGLVNPSRCAGGTFDGGHLGPWSAWLGDLDADVMVVGQDWGDRRYFEDHGGQVNPASPTNVTLIQLLDAAGLTVPPADPTGPGGARVFLTNAILCLKTQGRMQGAVRPEWFDTCGREFLRPLIELVGPRVVISLGERAYRAVVDVYGLRRLPFPQAVEAAEGFPLAGGTRLFPRYHCGRRIQNTHRPLDRQLQDWARLQPWLTRQCPARVSDAGASGRP